MKFLKSFLNGISRLIYPEGVSRRRKQIYRPSDKQAIQSDWQRVGDYLRHAMKRKK